MHHHWHHFFNEISRLAQLWFKEDEYQSRAHASSSLLHEWLCPSYLSLITALQKPHSPRAHPADVWCKEHDVCCRPSNFKIPYMFSHLLRSHVDQGSRWVDDECAVEEQRVLCLFHSQQHPPCHMWYSLKRTEDVWSDHRQYRRDQRRVPLNWWSIWCYA